MTFPTTNQRAAWLKEAWSDHTEAGRRVIALIGAVERAEAATEKARQMIDAIEKSVDSMLNELLLRVSLNEPQAAQDVRRVISRWVTSPSPDPIEMPAPDYKERLLHAHALRRERQDALVAQGVDPSDALAIALDEFQEYLRGDDLEVPPWQK